MKGGTLCLYVLAVNQLYSCKILGLESAKYTPDDVEVYRCNDILRPKFDRIYIPKNYETQSNVFTILNSKREISNRLFATYDKDCVDQVFRVICHYYLPPCANFTHPLPPSSICQEECSQVQSQCQETWKHAEALLNPHPFINCNDTSQLLFPLPNCCTGDGILAGTFKQCFVSRKNCQLSSRCSSSKFWNR